jgi:hypothetical protein
MSPEEPKAFVVRDRRSRGDEEVTEPKDSTSGSSDSRTTTASAAEAASQLRSGSHQPLTFSSFIFSLGTSALMMMGEQLDPQQPRMPANLVQAKEIIDILSMLEEKTRGNLTADEGAVLSDMLYALRMKYVDQASSQQASKLP